MELNRATRRAPSPAKPRRYARHGSHPSPAKAERKALRVMRGVRTVDGGLVPVLDKAFGILTPLALLAFGVGRDTFSEDERRRRRARGKRQRAARRAGR